MTGRMPRSVGLRLVLVLLCGGEVACGDAPSPPAAESTPTLTLVAPDAVTVQVGERVEVRVRANNPEGLPLVWRTELPPLAGMESAWAFAGTPDELVLRYDAAPGHEGDHSVGVVAQHGAWEAQTALGVRVRSAPTAPPVFVAETLTAVVDLERTSCVESTLRVTDADSNTIVFRAGADAPAGFSIAAAGPLAASIRWCPSEAQLATSLQWSVRIEADDGDHVVPAAWQVLFRRSPEPTCAGSPPQIAIVAPRKGEELAPSTEGTRIDVRASDDEGLPAPPLLLWTTAPVDELDAVDLGGFARATCVRDPSADDRYACMIPPFLSQGDAPAVVSIVATVTDDDDETGTTCDKTSDSALVRFVALPPAGDDEPPGCDEDCPPEPTCDAGGEHGTRTEARSVPEGALLDDVICARVPYYIVIDVASPSTLDLALVFASDVIDLELELQDEGGRVIAESVSLDDEAISHPVAAGRWYARVYGYGGDAGPFLFEWSTGPLRPCEGDEACNASERCVAVASGEGRGCASPRPE